MATQLHTELRSTTVEKRRLTGFNEKPFRTVLSPMDMDRHAVLTKLGLGALTCNSAVAIYRSRGDPATVAFVAGAYAAIVLLFYFLLRFERAGRGDRGRAKAAVWVLTTLLTAMFAARIAPLMPPLVAYVVWFMAVGTAVAGFWAFFLNH
ncbi:hypothetical protein E2562_004746 [Oryza meyeriana var. granulata]|uniref:Uncharacterized protein n=1 Tax=Oryza meyeriana var. granulata TaxID=110450 RepID=A0A6G1DDS7_9ORYZ|nr:hypothetical protein E2562_004746 [Oryza meyeriana var. granulata]